MPNSNSTDTSASAGSPDSPHSSLLHLILGTNERLSGLETAAIISLLCFVAVLQISIAASGILLTLTLGLWAAVLITRREYPSAPAFFGALVLYAGLTLLSVLFSSDPAFSLIDSREILLFLVVPVTYRFARGRRAQTVATVIVTIGAACAVFGIIQYGVLEYDNLGQRPSGSMGHYMTYSGLLVLVIALAGARALYDRDTRVWSALVMPALIVALGVTLTRTYWVGAGAVLALLFVLKDLRLLAVAPVAAALVLAFAPPQVTARIHSTFDLDDPTIRDRFALAQAGFEIIKDNPLTGVGPDMVQRVYPDYRMPNAVQENTPHLHNVPVHIAAERGLPALAVWFGFLAITLRGLVKQFQVAANRGLAAAGLAAVVGMFVGGLFEYNFGDSEFLMLYLVLITLPYAANQALHQPAP